MFNHKDFLENWRGELEQEKSQLEQEMLSLENDEESMKLRVKRKVLDMASQLAKENTPAQESLSKQLSEVNNEIKQRDNEVEQGIARNVERTIEVQMILGSIRAHLK